MHKYININICIEFHFLIDTPLTLFVRVSNPCGINKIIQSCICFLDLWNTLAFIWDTALRLSLFKSVIEKTEHRCRGGCICLIWPDYLN